jgi:hypothetical protein
MPNVEAKHASAMFLLALAIGIVLLTQFGWAQGSIPPPGSTQVLAHLVGAGTSNGSVTMAAATATGTDTFEGFFRYPAETQQFTAMNASTAYYRDVFEGGETFSSNAVDGDTIYAQIYNSSGTLISTWSSFVFHSSYLYNGQTLQNCWVGGGQILCGSNAIDVLWYIQLQCNDGAFTMKFYRNNVEFAEGAFTLLPQIEESRVQTYNQVPYVGAGYEYDHECRFVDQNGNIINPREKHTCSSPLASNEISFYIRAKGCFLSDAANLLTYHGVTVDPPTLNTALNDIQGGYINFNVSPDGLYTYSVQNGGSMSFVGRDRNLYKDVCTYGPQIMGVHCTTNTRTGRQNPGHWVTVYGQTADKSTWLIHDPNGGVSSTLAARYPAGYCASRSFSGPQYTFVTETGIRITFHSPVALLLTDGSGRRLGDDPITGAHYDEIPDAYYEAGGLDDDELGMSEDDPAKTLYVPRAATGQYTLTVTGLADGAYSAEFVTKDSNGIPSETDLKDVPIQLNQVQTFSFSYDSTTGSTLNLTGGFAGTGQRPADVNRLLTFASPMDAHVTLATGTTSYTVIPFYSTAVIPSSFTAVLNGTNVSNLFHPQPGSSEGVNIPLQSGRNVLTLQIDGNLPNRVATDTDRLVFDVQ